MFRIGGDAGQPFAGVAGLKNANGLVAGHLRQSAVERHQLVPELAGVLVHGREDRRMLGQAQIGLVERDLGRINRLRDRDAALDDIAPVLGVGGFAFPQGRDCQPIGRSDDDAVYVSTDTPASHRETELVAGRVAGAQIKSRLGDPVDGKVLKAVARRKDA